MSERSLASPVTPELVVTIDGTGRTLLAALYLVGRAPEADIVVTDPDQAWPHPPPMTTRQVPGPVRRPRNGRNGREGR